MANKPLSRRYLLPSPCLGYGRAPAPASHTPSERQPPRHRQPDSPLPIRRSCRECVFRDQAQGAWGPCCAAVQRDVPRGLSHPRRDQRFRSRPRRRVPTPGLHYPPRTQRRGKGNVCTRNHRGRFCQSGVTRPEIPGGAEQEREFRRRQATLWIPYHRRSARSRGQFFFFVI
jgi:hypothetical protein